jgi:CubicO group peptidase (beta-lactamase class C family)
MISSYQSLTILKRETKPFFIDTTMAQTSSKLSSLIIIPLVIIVITSFNYFSTNRITQDSKDWSISTPEAENMSPDLLEKMRENMHEERLPVDSVIIIRNGCIVMEEYPSSSIPSSTKRKLYSATKSITSALIGIAIQEGYIEGVDQKIIDYFPDKTIADKDRRQMITIKHLLTMTGGYEWGNDGTGSGMRNSADPVQYVLDKPMVQDPGNVYNYGDGSPFLLGAIIYEVTGMTVLEFAEKYLFTPLNITDVSWESSGDQYFAASGLWMRPRDMAKIGQLFLNYGKWGEKQVISQDWITESTETHVSGQGFMAGANFDVDGYGYLWWTYPESGVYYASGMYEQRIYVCPELDLVAVFTSHNDGAEVTPRLLFHYILPACNDYTHNSFSKYGLSFSYPRGMKVIEAPSPFGGEVVSEESGFVQAYFSYGYESISVMWYPKSNDMDLDSEIEGLFSLFKSEKNLIERGSIELLENAGQDIHYMSANVTENGYTTSGMIGCWYSEGTDRVVFTYIIADPLSYTQEEIRNMFFDHISTFQEY